MALWTSASSPPSERQPTHRFVRARRHAGVRSRARTDARRLHRVLRPRRSRRRWSRWATVPSRRRPPGWVVVDVRAATLNHHDVWSARGVGLTEKQLPMILGCDAAGVDPDGSEVVVHAAVNDPAWVGPEELDPKLRAALRGAAGRAGRAARGPRRQPRAQAARAELRGGGLPAHRLAHRLPHAVHARRARPGRDRARPGRLGRPLHRADRARRRRRPARLGHRPRRGASARSRRSSARTRRSSPARGCRSASTR